MQNIIRSDLSNHKQYKNVHLHITSQLYTSEGPSNQVKNIVVISAKNSLVNLGGSGCFFICKWSYIKTISLWKLQCLKMEEQHEGTQAHARRR